MHHDTTPISLSGAYANGNEASHAPRPAEGHNKEGRGDRKQGLLRLGVSGDGGLPVRMGRRDGNLHDSVAVSQAIEESLALGRAGFKGIVADAKAYSQRTLGLCLEPQVGLVTWVPRTCGIRQEVEAWGQKQSSLPLFVDKPARRRRDTPRRWYGRSLTRKVAVAYADGRIEWAPVRFVAVSSHQLAQHQEEAYGQTQGREAEAVAEQVRRGSGDALLGRPMRQRPAPSMRGRGQANGGGGPAGGATMRCTPAWTPSGGARNVHTEGGRAKAKRWNPNGCIGYPSTPRP